MEHQNASHLLTKRSPSLMYALAILCLLISALASAQTYYLPPGVSNIRAMVVGGTPLAGGTSQIWRDFAFAQRVGYAQQLSDLPAIAAASGHPEIANAPFVSCGQATTAQACVSATCWAPAPAAPAFLSRCKAATCFVRGLSSNCCLLNRQGNI
jgi:hypothetical protein